MELIPVGLFWALLVMTLFMPGPAIFYLLFASLSFGSFAIIPTNLTQGFTLMPSPLIAIFIVVLYAGGKNGMSRLFEVMLKPSQGFLLFMFWVVTIWVTLFMPRIFAGVVTIMPMRAEEAPVASPLQPTMQNFSQLMYLTISILTVFGCTLAFRSPGMRQHIFGAICFGGAVAVFTGMLDFMGQYLPLEPLLALFRTASYAFLTDVEISNVKRVVGLMPEASSYGGLVVSFLAAIYFSRRAITSRLLRQWIVPPLLFLLLAFSILSTSSTAYAGLALFGAAAGFEWLWRAFRAEPGTIAREGLAAEFWAVAAALSMVYLLALFKPSIFDPLLNLVDTLIIQKSSSDSFEERSMWTAISLQALWDSWGLGVGVGATRASNGVVAVFSNSGILGGVLYYAFLLHLMLLKAKPSDEMGAAILNGVRFYLPIALFMGILAGTSADFGVMSACIYALALAMAGPRTASAAAPAYPAFSGARH